MKNFVSKILSKDLLEARNELEVRVQQLIEQRINQIRMRIVAELFEEIGLDVEFSTEDLSEGNVLKMGRMKMVRVRIRNGKVQRRRKLSAIKGYTTRNGRLIRMSPIERRNRKISARKSKFKRRAKLRQSLRKRKMSLRRRSAMGLG